jgi:hypothetical protein
MTVERRVGVGLIAATATALAGPLLALADTGPAPAGVPGPDTFDASPFAPYVGLAILILVAILAVRSPGSRRPIAAVVVAIATALGATAAIFIPAFSCFDCGQKPDMTPWAILAIVIAIVGVVLIILIMRIGRSSSPAADAPSNRTD